MVMRSRCALLTRAALAVGIVLPTAFAPQEETAPPPTVAIVKRVIDGDTIVLESGERVRLIGVNTPERGKPGAKEATAFLRDLLEGEVVLLSYDRHNAPSYRDRYERLLAYVALDVNLAVVRHGHSAVYDRYPFTRLSEFRRLAHPTTQQRKH